MKLKIYRLEKGPMILTGSKVLEVIQDNYTPPIDLLVRESIQNSADAILENKAFGKIYFNLGTFDKTKLANSIDAISNSILNYDSNDLCNFLSIRDSNTCGLLGEPFESESDEPNNLYNLVYDIMNSKPGVVSGGSRGVGKSIYYRYGKGICFYYSKTYENGTYLEKLAGSLIQNEKKEDCSLGKNSSGIAYFGDLSSDKKPMPIYEKKEIEEFLNIFGLKPYGDDETGTTLIIPFIDINTLLTDVINDNQRCYWLADLEESLNIAIQRWYFPRINNESFCGKYLKIAINNKKIELNNFYNVLQQLYNGKISGCKTLEVYGGKSLCIKLGKFNYKVFDKEEIGMNPPSNLPSPKYLTDSSYEVDEKGLLFYVRKPGMIINYDNVMFGNYSVEEGKYLIGVFVLNDANNFQGENIGAYFRKSEEGNHKEWNDINCNDFPKLKSRKPFRKICSVITKKLTEEFKQTNAVALEGSNTVLQKKLGEKLMPPLDYGNQPEPDNRGSSNSKKNLKEKKLKIDFAGISQEGFLIYNFKVMLKNNETLSLELNVKVGGKSLSFNQWGKIGFEIPCSIERIDIDELCIDRNHINSPQNIPLDPDFTRRRKKTVDNVDIYKVRGLVTENGKYYGLGINNCCGSKMMANIKMLLKPLDKKYMIGFNISFKENGLL